MFVRSRDLERIADDLTLIMASLMAPDAKLDTIEELIRDRSDDDEEEGPDATWEETKRLLRERIEWHAARKREREEREERRRRRRLRRLSFGLLGG